MTATTTKERPILFSAPMVRAILDGRKTMTRRVMKSQPDDSTPGYWAWCPKKGTSVGRHVAPAFCPYGKPGERLWVRETWRVWAAYDNRKPRDLSGAHLIPKYDADGIDGPWRGKGFGKYRHARFMPRWASRITLEIESVRVERLNEISEADAEAEGPTRLDAGSLGMERWSSAFRNLWIDINGHGSWETNPWVWVVSFTTLNPREATR